jgi:hypothetical protein
MADVVNLRHARKQKARADKEQEAAENRAKFGRTKGEKKRDRAEDKLGRKRLDQAQLDKDE